jgi:hypothetical protein
MAHQFWSDGRSRIQRKTNAKLNARLELLEIKARTNHWLKHLSKTWRVSHIARLEMDSRFATSYLVR